MDIDKADNSVRNQESNHIDTLDPEGSWMLITDAAPKIENEDNDENDHVEILKDDDSSLKTAGNESTDELSDGISVIGEDSGSAGRNSPTGPSSAELLDDTINLSETDRNFLNTELKKEILSLERKIKSQSTNESNLANPNYMNNFCFKRGISGFFYLSVFFALVAFLAKIKYPEWHENLQSDGQPISQRMDDLELQNNLLRAEIDLLSKQLNHLRQSKDFEKISKNYDAVKNSNKFKKSEEYFHKEEKIKVWPGGGELKQTEIPKIILKTPHSCDDPNQHFEGVCFDTENSVNNDESKQKTVINNAEKKDFNNNNAETIIDRIAVPIGKIIENKFGSGNDNQKPDRADSRNFINDKFAEDEKKTYHKNYNSENLSKEKEFRKFRSSKDYENHNKYDSKIPEFKNDFRQKDHKKSEHSNNHEKFDKFDDKKFKYNNEKYDKTDKTDGRKMNYEFNERDYERKNENQKNSKDFNSKESFKRKEKINENKFEQSREKYDRDWHEKYMEQREKIRKQHKDNYKDDWYLERGHAREEARILDKDYKSR